MATYPIARTVPVEPAAQATTARRRRGFGRWFMATGWRHVVGIVTSAIAVFPLLYVVSTSFATSGTLTGSNQLFRSFTLDNYVKLVSDPGRPFVRWWFNTMFVSLFTAVASVFLCTLAAYAFSRLRFSGRRIGLGTLVITQMFPQFLGVVAIFLLLVSIGNAVPSLGLDTLPGLVLVYLGGALGVNTYLMYGYFNTIPRELDEAAKIDGAGHARIFFTIILRLVGPILVVIGMLVYIGVAGDFVIASVVLSDPRSQTAAVGLFGMISLFRNDNWGTFCAGAVLTALPVMILFLYTQKYIVTGLFAGSGK
ncbi:sugar ABC transporter permease [Kineosporia sp. A_224]|uniref:sugar ABC transporter permease n=1 Tax=Kineosporia sp. A_224 TaxID=1962180 RepID=UPI000B4AC5B9|nr:sugar ABC transporter permease [Kineosporia sp. A_224]